MLSKLFALMLYLVSLPQHKCLNRGSALPNVGMGFYIWQCYVLRWLNLGKAEILTTQRGYQRSSGSFLQEQAC